MLEPYFTLYIMNPVEVFHGCLPDGEMDRKLSRRQKATIDTPNIPEKEHVLIYVGYRWR